MKYYDLVKIKLYVNRRKDKIDRIDIGIREDWMNTNQRIFVNGHFIVDLPEEGNKVAFRSIQGSMWGTPVMRVVGIDGGVDVIKCYFETGPRLMPHRAQEIDTDHRLRHIKRLGWDGVLRDE